jgi:hypothetical protein
MVTMKRTSPRRQQRARVLLNQYPDAHGILFAEHHLWLPAKVSDWPQVWRVDDPVVCQTMHKMFQFCWACGNFYKYDCDRGYYNRREIHHITGGIKGRSDEMCNVSVLCTECHKNANTAKLPIGRILFLKWREDRQHCDWVRLALLARRFLPDLITDVKAVSK